MLDYFPNRVADPTLVRPEMWNDQSRSLTYLSQDRHRHFVKERGFGLKGIPDPLFLS